MKYLLSLIILTSCVFIINAQEHLEVDGAINIQKAVGTGLGTIEYNGAMDDFRGRTTAGWKSFTSGTGGSSLWSTITGTNHIGYTAGNVAIGGTSVTGSMLSLEGNTQSMLRLQGTGSGGAYQQFFSNGSYWGLIGDENGDGSDLYFDIKSRSGASGIAFSTSTLNNAMRIENNGQVQISNLPAAADTDSYVTADAAGKLRKINSSNIVMNYLLSLPNGIQTLLAAGETPQNLLNAGVSLTDFIGRNYAGGIIFYIKPDGTGLVAAPSDLTTTTSWGCYASSIPGADGLGIGAGYQNTMDIVAGCSTSGIAAQKCADLFLNGFSDWYLPSKDELNEIYTKIGQGASGANMNIGNFSELGCSGLYQLYWSSSEDSNEKAWAQQFCSGGIQSREEKSQTSFFVRPIRAF